jgi:hypothetical protein
LLADILTAFPWTKSSRRIKNRPLSNSLLRSSWEVIRALCRSTPIP